MCKILLKVQPLVESFYEQDAGVFARARGGDSD
jgi:hypothetical protein